ncbi:unnamed protein product [Ectocarpus fasciculatus]
MAPRTPAKQDRGAPSDSMDIREAVKASVAAESKDSKLWGFVPNWFRTTVGPLFLILVPPFFVVFWWHLLVSHSGSWASLWGDLKAAGPEYVLDVVPSPVDPAAWKYILGFGIFEIVLMVGLPGKAFRANPTATGHIPVYKANGMLSYLVTLATLCALVATDRLDPKNVYDKLGEIFTGLSVFSLFFVLLLTVKGLYFPSTDDSGSNGSFLQNYWWGTELYPRVFGADVKMFTNCRFGMMYWAVGAVIYAYTQQQMYGKLSSSMAVSVILQLTYITKFFHWEMGYMNSMDIQHDRAGYYLCWGCLVWVPAVYSSPGIYLVKHPISLGWYGASAILLLGLLSIWANFDADRQRHAFRQARTLHRAKGDIIVWGKPAEYITAGYINARGEKASSLLLCTGWWGVARHFHYLPEITGAFFWTVPALFETPTPYFYVIFLVLLLTDRAFRDDTRCRGKYGKHWDKYCAQVPYKIVPGIL